MPKASGQTLNKSGPHPVPGPDRANGPARTVRVARQVSGGLPHPMSRPPAGGLCSRRPGQLSYPFYDPFLRPVSPARFPVRLYGLAARFDFPVRLPDLTEQSNFAAIVPRHTTRTPPANGLIRPSGGPKQPSVRAACPPCPPPCPPGRVRCAPRHVPDQAFRTNRPIEPPDLATRCRWQARVTCAIPICGRIGTVANLSRPCPDPAPVWLRPGSGLSPILLRSEPVGFRSGSGLAPSMVSGHSRLVPVERNLPRLAPNGPGFVRACPTWSNMIRHDPP